MTEEVHVEAAALKARVLGTFEDGAVLTHIDRMRLPGFDTEDSYMMVAAFVGRRWHDLSSYELFFHRDSIMTLSAEAYRAYLPAYLCASLDLSSRYAGDIFEYLLFTLRYSTRVNSVQRMRVLAERLSLLTKVQFEVLTEVLFFFALLGSRQADEVLSSWEGMPTPSFAVRPPPNDR